MAEPQLLDPYLTPRTQPARGPIKYVVFGIIIAVILLTFLAASLMVWMALSPSRLSLDRSPPIDRFPLEATRGPVPDREIPPLTPDSAVP
jgi:hypothetical protein